MELTAHDRTRGTKEAMGVTVSEPSMTDGCKRDSRVRMGYKPGWIPAPLDRVSQSILPIPSLLREFFLTEASLASNWSTAAPSSCKR